MRLSDKHDAFSLHPALARFVEAATRRPLPGCILRPPLHDMASYTPLQIQAREKRTSQDHPFVLLGPLLPLLCWPHPHQPPVGLPLIMVSPSESQLERMLSAELLRHALLSPLGPVPEWVRQLLNDALAPAGRQQLFGCDSKLSQQQFADWLGLSRAQLAHQARHLSLVQAVTTPPTLPDEPAYFRELRSERS